MKRSLMLSLLAVGLSGCFAQERTEAELEPITVSGNSIQIRPGGKFLGQLQISQITSAPGGEHKLRTVGQMVAIANPSGELTTQDVAWSMLDPGLIHSLGLRLSASAPIGLAYGVTGVHLNNQANNHGEIYPGEKIQVYRYGLRQNSTLATVVFIQTMPGSENEKSVIFSIAHGRDWYPGTNCEIEFPLVQRQAVALSPLSMLHEGIREYVLKEISPGQFVPEEIVVLNETRDQVYALGELSPGDHVVERGAILLKPVIHEFLEAAKELRNVR